MYTIGGNKALTKVLCSLCCSQKKQVNFPPQTGEIKWSPSDSFLRHSKGGERSFLMIVLRMHIYMCASAKNGGSKIFRCARE